MTETIRGALERVGQERQQLEAETRRVLVHAKERGVSLRKSAACVGMSLSQVDRLVNPKQLSMPKAEPDPLNEAMTDG